MTGTVPSFGQDYVELAADIVSAYVSNNSLPVSELPGILSSVHAAISNLAAGGSVSPAKDEIEKATTAQIKKSITPDGLISFEDGKSYKTMRRHLTIRGLSPETYRAKYGLPSNYPMTAPSYSAQRSQLARDLGLGRHLKGVTKATAPDKMVLKADTFEAPKRVGRPPKAAAAE